MPFDKAAESEAWLRERQLGLVVDRLRVVEVAAPRLARGHEPGGASTLAKLNRWVEEALHLARTAA